MFRFSQQGLCRRVSLPRYGKQDIGMTPGGAMDSFALRSGNALLENPEESPALEILLPPVLEWEQEGYFVLTGAPVRSAKLIQQGREQNLFHGQVYKAEKGDTLRFGQKLYGLRTYLCYREAGSDTGTTILKNRRPPFGQYARWPDQDGYIRVMEGPEYSFLENPELFFQQTWTVSHETSDMGMRLECTGEDLKVKLENMVSEAVATGTVQLTPKGPIILLKHRQTVGGYPRIYNIISADTDLLGQFAPGHKIRFKKVSHQEALSILKQQNDDIEYLKKIMPLED